MPLSMTPGSSIIASQQRSPVAVVVISSNGEGDRSVGSMEVKAFEGRAYRSDPYRGASKLAGRSKCVNQEAPKYVPRAERIAGGLGVPSRPNASAVVTAGDDPTSTKKCQGEGPSVLQDTGESDTVSR